MIPAKSDTGALANRINLETKSIHDTMDKLVSMKFVLAMKDYKLYRQGLQSFYHVFVAIERNIPVVMNSKYGYIYKEVWDERIARKLALEKDLFFYYNNDKFLTPIHKTQIEFQQHIDQIAQEKPHLLLAYLHVMYLALFAGGKVMKKSLQKNIGFFPKKQGLTNEDILNEGMNFFNFDVENDEDLKLSYKENYELATRNNLTEEEKLEIIEESKYIFSKNFDCVNELEKYNMNKVKNQWLSKFDNKFWVVLVLLVGLIVKIII